MEKEKNPKQSGCCLVLFIIVLSVIIVSGFNFFNDSDSPKYEKKNIPVGMAISAGNFIYTVKKFRFAHELGNDFTQKVADGVYLVISLSVENISKETRTVDNMLFKLTDNSGTTYESSQDGTMALELSGSKTLFLKQCQPNIEISGYIVFEVPKKGTYNLEVSGGFFNKETATIKIE